MIGLSGSTYSQETMEAEVRRLSVVWYDSKNINISTIDLPAAEFFCK